MHDFALMLLWIRTKLKTWCAKMLVPNSAQTVAAAVPRSPELICALNNSAEAEAKQKKLRGELSDLKIRREWAPLTAAGAAAIDARLETIRERLHAVEKLRLVAWGDIQRHQINHAEAVRSALSQHRREAAARVVATIAELVKVSAELDETAKAITGAGGKCRRLPPIPYLDAFAKIARAIESDPSK